MSQAERHDSGFTLIELLISIALMGILMTSLVAGFMAVSANSASTMGRMEASHDAQLANAYFADDVAAAGVWKDLDELNPSRDHAIEVGTTYETSSLRCGAPGTQANLRMAWTEYGAGGSETRVVVAYLPITEGTERHLVRLECQGANDIPISSTVVVHNLAATGPTVTCRDLDGAEIAPCTGKEPARIDLDLAIDNPDDPTPSFTVKLTGWRRQI